MNATPLHEVLEEYSPGTLSFTCKSGYKLKDPEQVEKFACVQEDSGYVWKPHGNGPICVRKKSLQTLRKLSQSPFEKMILLVTFFRLRYSSPAKA